MFGYLVVKYFFGINNAIEIYVSKIIMKVINFIVDHIDVNGLLGLTACLFGLLVPIAILLIENNGNKQDKSFTWDKMVLFSKVVNTNFVVLGFFFLTIPLVFWSNVTDTNIIKVILFFVYLSGFILVSISLKQCYEWIISKNTNDKNFRTQKREEFIKELSEKDFNLKIEIWDLIWKSEDERIGLNEQYLLTEYINQYFSLTNNQDRLSFIELYFGDKFTLSYANNQQIKNFLKMELIRIYSDNEDYNSSYYLFKRKLLYIFNVHLKEYLDGTYFYGLKDWLNQILIGLGNKYPVFLKENGISLLEVIREKVEEYDIYELENFLPDSLVYDKVTSDKQKAVIELFFNWLDESNALNFKKSTKDKLFAQNLLEFLFLRIEPIAFFRIISFSIFIKDYALDKNNLENAISRYAHEPNNGLGVGRLGGDVTFGGSMESFKRKMEEDQKWTYDFIHDLAYLYLNDEDYLDIVLESLHNVVSKGDHIPEIGIIYLKGIIIELESYKKYIFE